MSCLPDNVVVFDFETYSEVNLKDAGGWFYSIHPSTIVLCMAYSINGGPVQIWHPGDPFPAWVTDPDVTVAAWNSFFEYCIWTNVLGLPFHGYDHWLDVAACAAAMSLPLKLEKSCAVLGAPPETSKLKRGAYLISRLSKPVILKGTDGKRGRLRDERLEREMDEYCMMDVTATSWIASRIRPLDDTEYQVWQLDFAANARGVKIDVEAVQAAIGVRDELFRQLDEETRDITGGAVESMSSLPHSTKAWVGSQGVELENWRKEYLAEVLKRDDVPDDVRRLIEIRLIVGRVALKKYDKLLGLVDPRTQRLHGMLVYHGASTGRWAGRLFQPQNLPRPEESNVDPLFRLLLQRDLDGLDMFAQKGAVEVLSTMIRGMIVPSNGTRLVVSDYSSIEARVLAWLAGAEDKLEVFRTHGMVYEDAASKMYGVDIDEVDYWQRLAGKVAELALGYQGAVGALRTMADSYGVEFTEAEAVKIVRLWRQSNPKIAGVKGMRGTWIRKGYWQQVEDAYTKAVKNPGHEFCCGPLKNVAFKASRAWLACRLPSKRVIWFRAPRMGTNRFGGDCVKVEGMESKTKKWVVKEIYGGWMVESIVQAIARDLMAHAMIRLDPMGYKLLLTVHDEIISEAKVDSGSLTEYCTEMARELDWTVGLPVKAEGFEGERYGK